MAVLLLGAEGRCAAAQLDLWLLAPDAALAVSGVPRGAHHLSLLDGDGWSHGWVWVAEDDSHVAVDGPRPAGAGWAAAPAPGAAPRPGRAVAYPGDPARWRSLSGWVRPPWPVTAPVDTAPVDTAPVDTAPVEAVPPAGGGDTRLDRALLRAGGDEATLLGELQASFVEGWLLPDASGELAARRWRHLVGALCSAGPAALAERPGLFVAAVGVLVAQAEVAAPAFTGLGDELGFLAEDLAGD